MSLVSFSNGALIPLGVGVCIDVRMVFRRISTWVFKILMIVAAFSAIGLFFNSFVCWSFVRIGGLSTLSSPAFTAFVVSPSRCVGIVDGWIDVSIAVTVRLAVASIVGGLDETAELAYETFCFFQELANLLPESCECVSFV